MGSYSCFSEDTALLVSPQPHIQADINIYIFDHGAPGLRAHTRRAAISVKAVKLYLHCLVSYAIRNYEWLVLVPSSATMHALVILAVLEAIYSSARASAPSAGDCGPTSIPNVPGCWGTEVQQSILKAHGNNILTPN